VARRRDHAPPQVTQGAPPLKIGVVLAALALALALGWHSAAAQQAAVEPMARWWSAANERERARAAEQLVSSIPFDALYRSLARGRPYRADVERGRIVRSYRTTDGTEHPYYVVVPDGYDPARSYPVRVYFHGGIGRQRPGTNGEWWTRSEPLLRDDAISVFPAGWAGSRWWQRRQVENVDGILRAITREYNVDPNRVYLFGVSDGASGTYFHAIRAPMRWAGFVALIGHPAVLSNPRLQAGGEVFARNLINRPMFVANAMDDRLYPVGSVLPFVDLFRRLGADITFRRHTGDHSVSWWPDERERIDTFIRLHPRDPLPEHLFWETETTDHFNRFHWIVIDELGDVPGDATRARPLDDDPFPHVRPSGWVEAHRRDNTVSVTTYRVRRITILLSPDAFDLRAPVTVIVNGQQAFSAVVRPSVATLLAWAGADDDRAMLFGAALDVTVGSSGGIIRVVD